MGLIIFLSILLALGIFIFIFFYRYPEKKSEAGWTMVFESGHQAEIAAIKSLLEAHEIPYTTRNESTQNLIGIGNFVGGYNYAIGPMQIWVPQEQAEEARKIIEY